MKGPNGGKVTSEHGPCDGGGEAVRSALLRSLALTVEQMAYVKARLDKGEEDYGATLLVGWPRAAEALEEEMADAVAYAVAAERWDVVLLLTDAWKQLGRAG